ncbi:MAG: hypothetical protein IPG05_09795 [Gemmatimonadetes bacterium]|nr:hypothetical protein [Gemmatimonadota bacterium]
MNRPLIVVGGLGKLGFFGLTRRAGGGPTAYSGPAVRPSSSAAGASLNATPDLILAGIFLLWARAPRP